MATSSPTTEDDIEETSSQDALFTHGCDEVSEMRRELNRDRVFEIHAESMLIRRSRIRMGDKCGAFEQRLKGLLLSFGVLTVVTLGYPMMDGKTGKALLGGSSLLFGVSAIRMWHPGHFRERLARWWALGRWKLFDFEMLSPENRDVSRRLCEFLDHAQSPMDGDQFDTVSGCHFSIVEYLTQDAIRIMQSRVPLINRGLMARKSMERYTGYPYGRRIISVSWCLSQGASMKP